MRKKALTVALLFFTLLAALYLVALGFKLSYIDAQRKSDAARENLPSTDLSTLFVASYQPGDVLSAVPERYRGEIHCEDGSSAPCKLKWYTGLSDMYRVILPDIARQ